jgi:hypothetical protein
VNAPTKNNWLNYEPHPGFGPDYPKLPGVTRHRAKANAAGSIAAMSKEDRRTYGLAVLAQINALNKAKIAMATQSHKCPCASGTWLSDGNAILAAIRRQHRGG